MSESNTPIVPKPAKPPKCKECGHHATVQRDYGEWWQIAEGDPLRSYFCPNGHLVVSLLRATQADIDRGRELAERYGW